MQRSIYARTNSKGAGRTFIYRFDYKGQLNLFKNVDPTLGDYTGATHADDLGFLFKNIFKTDIPIDSKDFEMLREMLNIYTNFARYGNPDVENNWGWKPYTSPSLPLSGLNISDESKVIEFPENQRIAVWNSIFEKENVSTFNVKGKL